MSFHAMLAKYAAIDARGRDALYDRAVKPYPGFSKDALSKRLGVYLIFESNPYLAQLFRLLAGLEDRHGIRFLLAGRDYPLHMTVLEGTARALPSADMLLAVQKEYESFVDLSAAVPMRYLLADTNTLLLCADYHGWLGLEGIRLALELVYRELGLQPHLIEDIYHSSLARVVDVGDTWDWVKPYLVILNDFGTWINKNGPPLKRTDVFVGTAWSFLNR